MGKLPWFYMKQIHCDIAENIGCQKIHIYNYVLKRVKDMNWRKNG